MTGREIPKQNRPIIQRVGVTQVRKDPMTAVHCWLEQGEEVIID